MSEWVAPADLDLACLELCSAMNLVPGITTEESCCGHGEHPYRIWFRPDALDALPALLYWFDTCHSGRPGWSVRVRTDCGRSSASFCVEGPVGAYDDSEAIALLIRIEHEESDA